MPSPRSVPSRRSNVPSPSSSASYSPVRASDRAIAAVRPRTTSPAPSRSRAAVLLRKILFLRPEQRNPIRTVVQDVVAGTVAGSLLMTFLLFVDYRIVALGSIGGVRRAAVRAVKQMAVDPDAIGWIEDETDFRIVPADVYDDMREEIATHEAAVREMVELGIEAYEREAKELRSKIGEVRKELAEIKRVTQKALGLDEWCGHCNGSWGNCNARVAYLVGQYSITKMKARLDVMKQGKCVQKKILPP